MMLKRTAFLRKYWQTVGLSELAYNSNYVLLQMYNIKISLGCSKMYEIPNRKEAQGRALSIHTQKSSHS